MQHAQAGLQAVEAEACPSREVVAEALVVHDFESAGHRVSMLVLLDVTIRARYCLMITKEVKWTEKTADGVRYAYCLGGAGSLRLRDEPRETSERASRIRSVDRGCIG
jgi:hypothetical protein